MIRSSVLALLMAVVVPVTGQAASWANEMFSARSFDFGSVERGEKPSHEFVISNTGTREVRIKSIRVSCSCTTAVAASGRIPAGESTVLTATMDTAGFQGSKAVTIYVLFDRPWRSEVTLRVSCVSLGKLGTEATEIDFGILSQGSDSRKRLNLDYSGPVDWQVKDLDFGNPHFTTEVHEVAREQGKVRYELDIKLLPTAPAGTLEDTIRVHTNDPSTPIIVVKAKAQIEADVVVSPASIRLGTMTPGQTIERKVMIKAPNPFKVVRVDNADGLLEYRSDDQAKTVQLVTLTLTMPAKGEEIPRHVDIVTDLNGERVVSLDIQK
ncbi:DUF1573 domain-containing protein [bacterium]|jgi:hypothetical protein|nr:DUF1573 domain-containing protein [bacterium]